MSNRRHDPCAHLRTKFGGLSKGQELSFRDMEKREKDGTSGAIRYMLDRGAFAEHRPLRLGTSEGAHRISPIVEKLPWNPAAPARVVALELHQYVYHCNERKDGRRGAFSEASWDLIATERVPHWDYDGVDPLIAREPYERATANAQLDYEARYRIEDKESIGWRWNWIWKELEAIESLKNEGCGISQTPADVIASIREGEI